jgi:hypothetical protein
LIELGADGFQRGQFDGEHFPGFGKVTHGGSLRRNPRNFNREACLWKKAICRRS